MKNRIKDFWTNFIELMKKREMSILPGNLAFFFVLSIVPIISLIVYVASSFNLPIKTITDFIESSFSMEVAKLLSPIFTSQSISIKSLFVIIIAFFLASNGADSIIIASNAVFNLPSSNYIRRRIKAIVITIILVILFVFILIVPLFGTSIINILTMLKINTEIFQVIYYLLNIPLSLLVIFIFIKIVYTIAPDEKIPSKYVNKGTLFTTILWIVITTFYSYYVNNIASYDTYYGGLSNIVILMLWFYFMANIFVIGLVLNYRNIEEQNEKTNSIKLNEIKEKIEKRKKSNKRE